MLIHTDKTIETPSAWEESDARYITSGDSLKLRSFTTKVCDSFRKHTADVEQIHRIDTNVAYAIDNNP